MSSPADLHALARTRAECAQRVADLGDNADPTLAAIVRSEYQEAENEYQKAISVMTNSELIAEGLQP